MYLDSSEEYELDHQSLIFDAINLSRRAIQTSVIELELSKENTWYLSHKEFISEICLLEDMIIISLANIRAVVQNICKFGLAKVTHQSLSALFQEILEEVRLSMSKVKSSALRSRMDHYVN